LPLPMHYHPTGPNRYTLPRSTSLLILLSSLNYSIIPDTLSIECLHPPIAPWTSSASASGILCIAPTKETAHNTWQHYHDLDGIHIYTDGSVSTHDAGYGIVMIRDGHYTVIKHRIPLHNTSQVSAMPFTLQMTCLIRLLCISSLIPRVDSKPFVTSHLAQPVVYNTLPILCFLHGHQPTGLSKSSGSQDIVVFQAMKLLMWV
jgi:hypothetical protein